MIDRAWIIWFKVGSLAIILALCFLAESSLLYADGFLTSLLRELAAIFRDVEIQWMVFLCLGIYHVAFLVLRGRIEKLPFWRLTNPGLWFLGLMSVAALDYCFDYPSTQAMTLLGCAVIGQGAAVLGGRMTHGKWQTPNEAWVFLTLLVMLLIGAVWSANPNRVFEYRGYTRWAGPWDNPNIAGLLMGTGVALAMGCAVSSFKFQVFSGRTDLLWQRIQRWGCAFVCFFAAVFMTRRLCESYSRGAWVATAIGVGYLICRGLKGEGRPAFAKASARQGVNIEHPTLNAQRSTSNWFKRNWFSCSLTALSVVVLAFWQFRHTEWRPARRAFSALNTVDFSWRNRVAAWEGALQIMAEHPWLGAGWNQPEVLYEHYYLPVRLTESAGIQMNDYLMLGATLGIPALVCFAAYIGLALFGGRVSGVECRGKAKGSAAALRGPSPINYPLFSAEWLQITCRAGAIVLLVGFWFDGGLFKLPTAATFWILLELGCASIHRRDAEARSSHKTEHIKVKTAV